MALLVKLVVAARLASAVALASPDVQVDRIPSAVIAAMVECSDPVTCLAIALHESGLELDARNGRCCGPGQVASSPANCRRIAAGDVRLGYREIERALTEARKYGDGSALDVLAAYASGPDGARGNWYRMPRAILLVRARLVRAMGARPGPGPAIGASS